jgi:hypothetical protein
MKARLLVLAGILFTLSTPFLSAQNALPDPHNDACWQSLSSLRACQLAEYNREAAYAQRCTSYPEYQCLPADEGDAKNPEKAAVTKHDKAKAMSAQEKEYAQPSSDRSTGVEGH